MKNKSKTRMSITIFLIVLIFVFIWFMSEKAPSYSEPQEALLATDKDMLLIPGYKMNGEALFFFIKDKKYLGASYAQEGLLGWKAGMLTWGSMGIKESYDEKLTGYSGYGDNLIYGLIKNGDDRLIKIDEHEAKLLNLEMLPNNVVEEYQLEGLYIWYFESENALDGGKIKLIDKYSEEQIDSLEF